jgi:hypothetical protein
MTDENSVTFMKNRQKAFEELRNAVQAAISAPTPAPVATMSSKLVSELRQLAELRDSGALTEDQFEAAKAQLLSGS